jgi:hypothetical protein
MDTKDFAFTVHEEENQGAEQQQEQTINQSFPNIVSHEEEEPPNTNTSCTKLPYQCTPETPPTEDPGTK